MVDANGDSIVEVAEVSSATDEEAKELIDEDALPEDLRTLTVYPEPLMTNEQTRHGGFILYVIGK